VTSTRQVEVGPLARYRDLRGVDVAAGGQGGDALHASVAGAERQKLASLGEAPETSPGTGSLHLAVTVVEAKAPMTPPPDAVDRALSAARSFAGLAGVGSGALAGRLVLEASLLAPDGSRVGRVAWEKEGAPEELAAQGGEDVGRAIARVLPQRRLEVAGRRAADERLLLTPAPQTLASGEVVVSDDELVLGRLGVGIGSRTQVDFIAGGIPIPAAGGFGFADHGVAAVGGAAAVLLGLWDLGVKVRVLDEQRWAPAVSVSYDLLDVFGLGAGGAGLVLFGNGAGGGGWGVVAGANAQFNVITAVAGKHFGPVQVTAGTYVLDNHHVLPQSAGFQGACVAAATDGSGATAGAISCGQGSATIPRLPTQVQPFVGSELVLGPHSSLMAEGLLTSPIEDSMFTTGARWLLGFSRARGPLALDRIRVRLDVAALWLYKPARGGSMPTSAGVVGIPWLGLGFYFL
jgi:hypothetical protein